MNNEPIKPEKAGLDSKKPYFILQSGHNNQVDLKRKIYVLSSNYKSRQKKIFKVDN